MSAPAQTRTPNHRLDEAFRQAIYRVHAPDGAVDVRIDATHDDLDRRCDHRRWCIITGYNPGAARARDEVNRRADRSLERRLRARRFAPLLRAVNTDPSGRWPDEPGWLFGDAGDRDVDALAIEFGQYAVVIGDPGRPARLRFYRRPDDRTPATGAPLVE